MIIGRIDQTATLSVTGRLCAARGETPGSWRCHALSLLSDSNCILAPRACVSHLGLPRGDPQAHGQFLCGCCRACVRTHHQHAVASAGSAGGTEGSRATAAARGTTMILPVLAPKTPRDCARCIRVAPRQRKDPDHLSRLSLPPRCPEENEGSWRHRILSWRTS